MGIRMARVQILRKVPTNRKIRTRAESLARLLVRNELFWAIVAKGLLNSYLFIFNCVCLLGE